MKTRETKAVAAHGAKTESQAVLDRRHVDIAQRVASDCTGLSSLVAVKLYRDGTVTVDYGGSPMDLVAVALGCLDEVRDMVPKKDKPFVDDIIARLNDKLGMVLTSLGTAIREEPAVH